MDKQSKAAKSSKSLEVRDTTKIEELLCFKNVAYIKKCSSCQLNLAAIFIIQLVFLKFFFIRSFLSFFLSFFFFLFAISLCCSLCMWRFPG